MAYSAPECPAYLGKTQNLSQNNRSIKNIWAEFSLAQQTPQKHLELMGLILNNYDVVLQEEFKRILEANILTPDQFSWLKFQVYSHLSNFIEHRGKLLSQHWEESKKYTIENPDVYKQHVRLIETHIAELINTNYIHQHIGVVLGRFVPIAQNIKNFKPN